MKRPAMLISALAVGLLMAACASGSQAETRPATQHNTVKGSSASPAAIELRHDMRKLWEDHITWTRLFIVSAVAGLPDQQVAAERLLRNQDDIGNAIQPYYGEEAGAALTKLLREHIVVAADLLTAAKAGDTAKVEKAKATWYDNADRLSVFLATTNPANWPKDAVSHHMRVHLDLTLEEAVSRLQGKFDADIAAYDKVHDAILELSDALTAGIVAQFPAKFAA